MKCFSFLVALFLVACGGDDADSGGRKLEGVYAWCDATCMTLDDGGLYFSGGKVFDASYDAAAATYCTYEQVGTYTVQDTTVTVTGLTDDGSPGMVDSYIFSTGILSKDGQDLEQVKATPAVQSSCPN